MKHAGHSWWPLAPTNEASLAVAAAPVLRFMSDVLIRIKNLRKVHELRECLHIW